MKKFYISPLAGEKVVDMPILDVIIPISGDDDEDSDKSKLDGVEFESDDDM